MSRPWVAGDVAMVTDPAHNRELVAVLIDDDPAGRCWHGARPDGGIRCLAADQAESVRPLVVIDPEDTEQVNALAAAFCSARWDHTPGSDECDPLTRSAMQQALRTYASPEAEEPQGLGARCKAVLSIDGEWVAGEWTRAETGEWVCLTDGMVGRTTSWAFLRDVEVLDA